MAALVWRCLLGLVPAYIVYLVVLCGHSLGARNSRSLRSAEQGLPRILFARTFTRPSRAFRWLALRLMASFLTLFSLPRSVYQAFLSQIKMALSGHAVAIGAPLSRTPLEEVLYKFSQLVN